MKKVFINVEIEKMARHKKSHAYLGYKHNVLKLHCLGQDEDDGQSDDEGVKAGTEEEHVVPLLFDWMDILAISRDDFYWTSDY